MFAFAASSLNAGIVFHVKYRHRQELVPSMTSLIVSALQMRLLLQTHRLQPQVGNRGREGLPDIRLL